MYNNPFIYQNLARPSFISRLLGRSGSVGLTNSLNWGNILSNTQKSLGIINQAIPIVQQVKPMVNNAKAMFKIANILNDNGTSNSNKNTNNSINSSYTNKESSNNFINKPIFYI